ncbi:MAG TPA: hypothetical protein VN950_09815 [Terriglobales bacterium]|nr:hypothetical protein [Terriglobales bacterium]
MATLKGWNYLNPMDYPHKPPSDRYLQKKVSYWESGHAKPNKDEILILSELLQIDGEELERWFALVPLGAESVFRKLADSSQPSLVAACYSGRPKATTDEGVLEALMDGLGGQVSLAMYYPYPLEFDAALRNEVQAELFERYANVWASVCQHYKNLSKRIPAKKRRHRIALYVPNVTAGRSHTLVPPSSIRHTLVLKRGKHSEMSRMLYVWVETDKIDGLHQRSAPEQQDWWQAYFGEPIRHWKETAQLSQGGKFWIRAERE